MKRIVVVGAGIAGTAAALAARRTGARVHVVLGRPGATVLSPGAVDFASWEDASGARPDALGDEARAVLDALGLFIVPADGVVLASTTGLVRPAAGADRALLDLSRAAGTILVPAVDHGAWDADALSRAWRESAWARGRSLSFVTKPASLMRLVDERAMPDAELALRHDDPGRAAWLAERLEDTWRQGSAKPDAILLPPWLGVTRDVARELSERFGVPCGEALASSPGTSGMRFEHARDRAFEHAGVQVVEATALAVVSRAATAWSVSLATGEALEADAVVLATGGLVGGGIAYSPAGAVLAAAYAPGARPLARLTIDAPARLSAHGRPLDVPGSLSGAAPESHAWPFASDPLLDHVGVDASADGRVEGAAEGLFAAGDVLADRPRATLAALASGAHAGATACRWYGRP